MATKNLYLLALVVWPLFPVTAATLRMVRMLVIAPVFGEQASYVIGAILLIAAMLTIMWVFVSRINGLHRPLDLLLIGVLWAALTVCSESGYFQYVPGLRWQSSLVDYFAGRHWVLIVVLLMMLCGPFLIGQRLSPKAVSNPPNDRTSQEERDRRAIGHILAILSLSIYVIGLGITAIVTQNRVHINVAVYFVLFTFTWLGASVITAIASYRHYPRPLFMLPLFMLFIHALTIPFILWLLRTAPHREHW